MTSLSARQSLQLDAVASGAVGVLLLALSGQTEEHLGITTGLSVGIGAFLLFWAAFVGWASTKDSLTLTTEIGYANLGWVVASVIFLVAADLTGLGVAVVIAQAVAVAVFAELQIMAVRKACRVPARSVAA
ncbi:MAG TPA: hypothetical protein VFK41_11135 [Nocardioidaceae bacterium]|nr:hypothetical protein [Nocardioidaceae bacterium]